MANAKHEPLAFSAADVMDKLRHTDRTPFIELLAGWLECAPDMAAVKAFAAKSPDKYVSAITQIARLSGYAEKHDHVHNHTHNVQNMSDSQLEDNLQKRLAELGLPPIIDITPTSVSDPSGFVVAPMPVADENWVEVEQRERQQRKDANNVDS